ncbi:MAG: hypothetical protein M1823_007803, partial [Watsoniomyces obsoletus]
DPARSCPLENYAQIVAQKQNQVGSFVQACFGSNKTAANKGLAAAGITGTPKTTFLTNLALPFAVAVKP